MGLADGKLAYQKIKPFIATRGCKPLTNPKEVLTVFVNHSIPSNPSNPSNFSNP